MVTVLLCQNRAPTRSASHVPRQQPGAAKPTNHPQPLCSHAMSLHGASWADAHDEEVDIPTFQPACVPSSRPSTLRRAPAPQRAQRSVHVAEDEEPAPRGDAEEPHEQESRPRRRSSEDRGAPFPRDPAPPAAPRHAPLPPALLRYPLPGRDRRPTPFPTEPPFTVRVRRNPPTALPAPTGSPRARILRLGAKPTRRRPPRCAAALGGQP